MKTNLDLVDKNYIDLLCSTAKKTLHREFNLEDFNFSDFEYINAYLLLNPFLNEQNLLINIYEREEKTHFYIPTIFVLSLISFYKNYISYHPDIKVGDILQRSGQTYKVVEIGENNYILKANKGIKRSVSKKGIETFIVTTAALKDRKSKIRFDTYKSFFNKIFKVKSKLPSKFKYKFLIITSKEIIQKLKEFELDSEKIHKAFPFEYISKSGKHFPNLPIDPMIYIVNDYETAKGHVFNLQDIEIDTIVFIGASKYREYISNIFNDQRKQKFKNCIFIGNEDIKEVSNLKKWNWTFPEKICLNGSATYPIRIIRAEDAILSELIQKLHHILRSIEDELFIELHEISKLIKDVFIIVAPDEKSRLRNQIEEFKSVIEKKAEAIILEKLDDIGVDDYEEYWSKIKAVIEEIINQLGKENEKYKILKSLTDIEYLVVPLKYVDIELWKEQLKLLGNSRINVIAYRDYKKLNIEQPFRICFLAYYGYNHLKSMLNTHHKITLLLYDEEIQHNNQNLTGFKNELLQEYCSVDRKELSGVDYPRAPQEESTSDLIERLFGQEFDDPREYQYERENLLYEIIFEDFETRVLDSNKTIILIRESREVPEKVYNLIEGDEIRVYDNTTKEQLYEIALREDKEGRFKEIEETSRLWKGRLLHFYKTEFTTIERLFDLLKSNGLTISNIHTLKKWLDPLDKVKFPQTVKDLYAIKRTLNDDTLNESFSNVLKGRRVYNSIMIALGRDLSEEITNYIVAGEKGKILKRFSNSQIDEIVQRNAPIRKIKHKKVMEIEHES